MIIVYITVSPIATNKSNEITRFDWVPVLDSTPEGVVRIIEKRPLDTSIIIDHNFYFNPLTVKGDNNGCRGTIALFSGSIVISVLINNGADKCGSIGFINSQWYSGNNENRQNVL